MLADVVATDEFTERLVEAVETAKRNPRTMVEYMSYYADRDDLYNAGRADGMEEGRKNGFVEGIESGIINTVRSMNGTIETAIQQLIIQCGMDEDRAAQTAELYWNEKTK